MSKLNPKLSLCLTDSSHIIQGDVSIMHALNLCQVHGNEVPNGHALHSIVSKGLMKLLDVGMWHKNLNRCLNFIPYSQPAPQESWTITGKDNWKKVAKVLREMECEWEYQKDNATNQLMLHQQFYSIIHDPAIPIANFIKGVFLVICKLDAIGHKLSNTEISNKILIGLDNSWSPVRTMLMLWSTFSTIDEITSALKQYEANKMGVKQESVDSTLYAKGTTRGCVLGVDVLNTFLSFALQ